MRFNDISNNPKLVSEHFCEFWGPNLNSIDSSSASTSLKIFFKKIIVFVVVGFLIVSMVVGTIKIMNFARVTASSDKVQTVIKDFMTTMKKKDIQAATALAPSSSDLAIYFSWQISELLKGNNYTIFEGFKDITIDTLNVIDSDPFRSNGTAVKVVGTAFYEDGTKSQILATLEEENSGWKIISFDANLLPGKTK
jgi:hypothetical protein